MANGDNLENLSWHKAAWIYLFRYGFQGAVALILLGAFLGFFKNPITDTLKLMEAQATVIQEHKEQSELLRKQLLNAIERLNSTVVQLCVQNAPTASDRIRCIGMRP